MRVENFALTRTGEAVRLTADIIWEEAPRKPFQLYYEIDARFAADLPDDGDAFLCSIAISASRDGERRVLVDRPVSRRLAEGVTRAVAILKTWYPGPRTLPRLESPAGFLTRSSGAGCASLCLTGGVDSMHALRQNRRNHSASDPRSFRRALYVLHLSFPAGDALARARDLAKRQLATLSAICEETDLDLCAVRTNVRLIEPSLSYSQAEGLGSLLSASAHIQARGLSSLSIASSSYEAEDLRPWGTHPLLDPNFSSNSLAVIHEDAGVPRTDKVRNIARWKPASRHLLVCFEGPLADGRANCGQCEKCLRTMTALLAVEGAEENEAFAGARVTAEAIRQMPLSYDPNEFPYLWEPLARSMDGTGRGDLASAIRRRVAEARRYLKWRAEKDWKGVLRRLDRRLLGGRLTAATRKLRGIR